MITGSCHCGRISFEAEGEISGVVECNCSHCSRKGYLLWFVPRERFNYSAQTGALATYTFNKHVINHHFCTHCGCAPFGLGTGPDGVATVAVNLRCAEGIDPATIERTAFDGRRY